MAAYRKEIQDMINSLQAVYDKANKLRDYATLEEKKVFNLVRQDLPGVWSYLQQLDNSLSDERAIIKII